MRRHRGRSVAPGACCAVCSEEDPVVLGPHALADGTAILCCNDAARARRRRGLTLDELRRELTARNTRPAVAA
ncbi:MAG TPA: hypothetical protein VM694_42710 [Polyangium sp.]|nr:hypothetical protein [Polyangium sp.]